MRKNLCAASLRVDGVTACRDATLGKSLFHCSSVSTSSRITRTIALATVVTIATAALHGPIRSRPALGSIWFFCMPLVIGALGRVLRCRLVWCCLIGMLAVELDDLLRVRIDREPWIIYSSASGGLADEIIWTVIVFAIQS